MKSKSYATGQLPYSFQKNKIRSSSLRIMELSARNKIKGKITEIRQGNVMAKISIEIAGGTIMSSVITIDSVEELKLKVGDEVYAIVKSTEVMIGK